MRIGQYEYVEDPTHPDRLVLKVVAILAARSRSPSPVRVRISDVLNWVAQKKAELEALEPLNLLTMIKNPEDRIDSILAMTPSELRQEVIQNYHLDQPERFDSKLTAGDLDRAFYKSVKKARRKWTYENLKDHATPEKLALMKGYGVFGEEKEKEKVITAEDKFRVLMYVFDTGAFSTRTDLELVTMIPGSSQERFALFNRAEAPTRDWLKRTVGATFYAAEKALFETEKKKRVFPELVTTRLRDMALNESNRPYAEALAREEAAVRAAWNDNGDEYQLSTLIELLKENRPLQEAWQEAWGKLIDLTEL